MEHVLAQEGPASPGQDQREGLGEDGKEEGRTSHGDGLAHQENSDSIIILSTKNELSDSFEEFCHEVDEIYADIPESSLS